MPQVTLLWEKQRPAFPGHSWATDIPNLLLFHGFRAKTLSLRGSVRILACLGCFWDTGPRSSSQDTHLPS